MARALDRCRRVAAGESWCAMLSGPPGLGKTHLAAAALQASVHPRPGMFFTHAGLLLWFRHRAFDKGEGEDVVSLFYQTNPALLVIDDLGTAKSSDWARQTLYEILNGRYERRLPTILTLNPDAPGVEVDIRIASRFYEGGVDCTGDDVRRMKGVTK